MIDSVISFIQYALLALAGFLFFGWLGLKIPAIKRKPIIQPLPDSSRRISPSGELPPLYTQYLFHAFPEAIHSPRSVSAWGVGKLRADLPIAGTFWLPIAWELHLKPGESFIWRVTVTWFTRPFIRGGEGFYASQGMYKMGSRIQESEFVNQSEATNLWIYTILFAPAAIADNSEISFQTHDASTIWLTINSSLSEIEQFKLMFNGDSGMPNRIDTRRTTSRDGTLEKFSATIRKSNLFPSVGLLPSEIDFAWDAPTYQHLKVNGIIYNTDVDREIENGI